MHDDLLGMRREKDRYFHVAPDSPLPPGGPPLRFFDPDPRYRVAARFEPASGHKHVRIGTSTGDERDYHEAGKLRFSIDGTEHTLTAYVTHDREDELFIPFRDATSGRESYGAARYIEVPYPEGREVVLDLNYAYNPYCAYNEGYSCPLPPRENWLSVAIRAGEKKYKDE